MNLLHIEHAFDHVKKACETRLETLYPYGIPKPAADRLEAELIFLESSDYTDDFEMFRLLAEEAKKSGTYFSLRGTANGSYITYLLGPSHMNPLPAHYYCPACGHFEIASAPFFGIDLPRSSCPSCKAEMISDGFNLAVESVWGTDGKKGLSFEYNIHPEFLPFAKRILEKQYPDRVIAPLGKMVQMSETVPITVGHCGYLLLPAGRTMDDYPDLQGYLDDGEPCLTGASHTIAEYRLFCLMLLPNPITETLVAMQRKTGIYIEELSHRDLQGLSFKDLVNTGLMTPVVPTMFHLLKPRSFTEMISIEACSHAAYEGIELVTDDSTAAERAELRSLPEFTEFPCYTREDIFDVLLTLGFTRKDALEISEFVRMGKAASSRPAHKLKFEQYHLPDGLKAVAAKSKYLFPRAHCAEYILNYAMLAFYMKKDSRGFAKVAKRI